MEYEKSPEFLGREPPMQAIGSRQYSVYTLSEGGVPPSFVIGTSRPGFDVRGAIERVQRA